MTGHQLPPDWQPTQPDMIYGLGLGLMTSQVLDIAEDLRLWAAANANRQVARKSNWSAAFRGWMRREAAKRGLHGTGPTNATMAAFDRIIAATEVGSGGGEGPLLDFTATGGGTGQAAGGAVAAREPTESWGLFPVDRQDPGKVPPGGG